MAHQSAPDDLNGGGERTAAVANASSDPQAEIIAFLRSARAYAGLLERASGEGVACYETHGALVFASGDDVYKIKRAVRFPYMDFSTLDLRERVIRREFDINKPSAPELYLGVVPVTRQADGTLALGGGGVPVEWTLHMRRFQDADLLSAVTARGGLDRGVALGIADAVAASHERAEIVRGADGSARFVRVLEQVIGGLQSKRRGLEAERVSRFADASRARMKRIAPLLDRRAEAGYVRRCHGDLHLGNIVMWRGKPLLFDALEFDDRLASIDTLYDMAFLLMDLDAAGHRATANLVLNRLLAGPRAEVEIDGLAALPLMIALRAAIRAMVGAERAEQEAGDKRVSDLDRARGYLDHALRDLEPTPPELVVVGGFSGTGKSTLAAALAPDFGATPGALHIRADVERKAMFGVDESERLAEQSYTADAGERVYAGMLDKAKRALAAGHGVVIDAVFSRPSERAAVEAMAQDAGVRFTGLWLAAPSDVLLARVGARVADASDATADVVAGQLSRGSGTVAWTTIEAGGTAGDTLIRARRVLGRN